ncbi:MAG: ABC transporter permease [Nitrospinae bacterium]|nr:ABC transporter permease [Nitrospinota bacterium]
MLDIVLMSLESIMANKIRSFLTMLGVVIGVASVILLTSLGEGTKMYVQQQLMGIGTNLLIITPGKTETTGHAPPQSATTRKLTYDDAMFLKRNAFTVKDVAPILVGTGKIKHQNRTRNALVLGVTGSFENVRNLHVEIGSFITEEDVEFHRKSVVIGRTVKKEIFGDENPMGKMIWLSGMKFRVVGIMEKKGLSLGFDIDDLIFIPIKTAQDLFDTDKMTEMLAEAVNAEMVDSAKEEIIRLLKKRHDNKEDFSVVTQASLLSTLNTILSVLTYVVGAIAGISLVVGGIGIMNIMLVSVQERTREIGIRKAIGAQNRDILKQFLVESTIVSAFGGGIGIIAGAGIAVSIPFFFPVVPVKVSLWSILVAFSFSGAVGVFFGAFPAQKAARLNPIDALRYE